MTIKRLLKNGYVKLFTQIVIITFFTWHAAAVAIYTVPRDAKDQFAVFTRTYLLPRVTPYMQMTSQWQLWNIFSPDPLRRVTFYRVETMSPEAEWRELFTVQPGYYSIWRHATQFKLMSNMLDEYGKNRAPLAINYLRLKCDEFGIPAGTRIRLRYVVYVVPYHEKRESAEWWNNWKPEAEFRPGFQTICL